MKLFLTEPQIHALLDTAKDHPRDYAMLHMMVNTGLRASDVVGLKLSDVIDSDGEIVRVLHIKMQKTRKRLSRALRNDCRDAVQAWINYRLSRHINQSDYLFVSMSRDKKYRQLNRRSVSVIVKNYLRRLFPDSLLRGNSSRTLRRSAAKLISKRTGRIDPATNFLGHSSVAPTRAYLDEQEFERQADEAIFEMEW